MCRAGFELAQAMDFIVDPFEGVGKNLLAFQWLFGAARKTPSPLLSLAPHFTLPLPCERPRLATLFSQTHLQCLQLFAIERVDRRMVRITYYLKLFVTKHAAFRLARYRHFDNLRVGVTRLQREVSQNDHVLEQVGARGHLSSALPTNVTEVPIPPLVAGVVGSRTSNDYDQEQQQCNSVARPFSSTAVAVFIVIVRLQLAQLSPPTLRGDCGGSQV
jgi:hypothetical protein